MDRVQIGDYLQDKQHDKTGKCKTCEKKICWNRQKLGNHKRSGNCVGQATEERQYFRGLVSEKSTTIPSPLPASSCIEEPPPPKKSKPAWVDTVTVEQKKCYDKTCANMFYDNAIPFVFAESESRVDGLGLPFSPFYSRRQRNGGQRQGRFYFPAKKLWRKIL